MDSSNTSTAGRIPPLVITDSGTRQLEGNNLIVGLIPEATYTSSQCRLKSGERILLTTDGITEAENNPGQQFGEVGLASLVRLPSLDAILERIFAAFQASSEAQDDWTLLDVR